MFTGYNIAMTKEINSFQRAILKNLFTHRYIGKRHTSEDNAVKGFPMHDVKHAKKELKKLIKKGYILQKPTYYGLEVSINPRMIQEISDIIKC